MNDALKTLPSELFEAIVDSLAIRDLIHIVRTDPSFIHVMEPRMFAPEAVSETLAVASQEGLIEYLIRAINQGANVSIGTVRSPSNTPYNASTLVLAARNGQDHAFRVLLKRGASMDAFGPGRAAKLCRRLLSRPDNEALLNYYLRVRPNAAFPLSEAILGNATLETIQLLLAHGAELDALTRTSNSWTCPLSSAIVANNRAAFELLLGCGADINGPVFPVADGTPPAEANGAPRNPGHLPIFAAAQTMQRNGTGFLERCLDLGVDINVEWRVIVRVSGWTTVRVVTPIHLMELPKGSMASDRYEVACQNLDFMLENGAVFEL